MRDTVAERRPSCGLVAPQLKRNSQPRKESGQAVHSEDTGTNLTGSMRKDLQPCAVKFRQRKTVIINGSNAVVENWLEESSRYIQHYTERQESSNSENDITNSASNVEDDDTSETKIGPKTGVYALQQHIREGVELLKEERNIVKQLTEEKMALSCNLKEERQRRSKAEEEIDYLRKRLIRQSEGNSGIQGQRQEVEVKIAMPSSARRKESFNGLKKEKRAHTNGQDGAVARGSDLRTLLQSTFSFRKLENSVDTEAISSQKQLSSSQPSDFHKYIAGSQSIWTVFQLGRDAGETLQDRSRKSNLIKWFDQQLPSLEAEIGDESKRLNELVTMSKSQSQRLDRQYLRATSARSLQS